MLVQHVVRGIYIIRPLFTLSIIDDEDEARTASLLVVIMKIILLALAFYGGLSLLNGHLAGLAIVGCGLAIVLSTLALMRRGSVYRAALIFGCLTWAMLTLASLAFGGLESGAYITLLLVTLVMSALVRERARLLLVGLTVISSLLLFVLQQAGIGVLPPYAPSPLFSFTLRVATFLMAALILHIISRRLNDALRRIRRSDQVMRALMSDLVSTSISRTYLDNVLRAISDILIVLGPDLRIERVNRAAAELSGFTEAELIGQTPDRIFSPDALGWLERARQEPIRTIETTLTTRAGQAVPISLSASLLYDETNAVQGVVCVAQDISESRRVAHELRKREELYRTLARTLPDMGVLLFDHDLRFIIAEGMALDASGYGSSRLEGRTMTEVLPPEAVRYLQPVYEATLAGQQTVLDWPVDEHIYRLQALPVRNESGSIFAGMILIQDITTIRQAEDELRRHIEQLTILRRVDVELNHKLDVPYVLNLALDLAVRVSMAHAGLILLLDDAGQLTVAEVLGSLPDEMLNRYPCPPDPATQHALDSGQVVGQDETRAIIPLISRSRPIGVLLLEANAPFTEERLRFMEVFTARVAVALDNACLYQVSQQQLWELQTLYDRVSQLEQLKTDMIRMAAHDLRNPINVISGFSELLLDASSLPLNEKEQVAHIFQAAQRMQKIVADILSLERIEHLQNSSLWQPFDLAALVQQIYDSHASLAAQHDFSCDLPGHPVLVRGDSPQLREAITNLVTNAIKYTPENGTIRLCLTMTEDQAVLEVVDNGYGIPEDMQQRLFQPFFRARSADVSHIEGTGLGLHLVKNVIERHNGTLDFHSVHGQGSTFGFRLPLVVDTDSTALTQSDHETT